jgi:murein DD-endopeptidase MepM/ murein hydrolase activator NlpD
MSNRVSGKALKGAVAIAAVVVAAAALSGCTALGGRAFSDPTTTGSVNANGTGNLNQPMPSTLGATQVAEGPFTPPADVGLGGNTMVTNAMLPVNTVASPMPNAVVTSDLPVLSSSTNSLGNPQAMPQQNLAPVTLGSTPAPLGTTTPSPNLVSVPTDAYVHVIESGESLYTIARKYDVTTQAIVQANGFSSPDKIFVGQKIVIPGRADLLAAKGQTQLAMAGDTGTQSPIVAPTPLQQTTQAIADPTLLNSDVEPKPVLDTASVETPVTATTTPAAPAGEVAMSGADKFRWPVSGKVIVDFAASKATGINIEAPEGTTVKAAENGTVIYVGSGVQGYGNLILIRHPNGYVSAYAHLKDMGVAKGQVVNRGDTIGATGMTGSVSKPQLHFELRKGATPVDPMPLLST